MGKSIKKNYMYNLIYELLAIIVPLVTTPYVSRVLGATAIGDYSYTVGIVSYFGIIAVTGTKNYGQREVAIRQHDKKERSVVFWEIFLFRVFCTIVVTVAYLIFIMNFMQQYKILFIIQLLTVLSWVADISWFFQGMEEFKVTAIRNSFVKIIGTILIFICVKSPDDLWIYTLIYSGTNFLGNLTMWFYIRQEILLPSRRDVHVLKNIKGIMALFIPVIAIQIYTILDKTMLGSLCNTTEVGYYSQAEKIIKLALTVLSSFIAVLVPRISMLYNQGSMDTIEAYYKKTLDFIFFLAMPMMMGCIAVSDVFVPIFFGKGYEDVIALMQIMSLLFIILSLGQLYGNFLVAMKRQKFYTLAVVVAAIINAFLNFIFLVEFKLGAIGVAWATIIAELACTIVQIIASKDILDMKKLFVPIIRYLLPSGIMFLVIDLIKNMIHNDTICLLGAVSGGILSYLIVLLFLRNETLWSCLYQLRNTIQNSNNRKL